MKTTKIRILLYCATCIVLGVFARQLADIVTKQTTLEGKGVTISKTYRGDDLVMMDLIDKRRGTRTRSFVINGRNVASESDEDNDGFFERLVIFDTGTEDFEIFTRETNNVVRPVSSEELERIKRTKRDADRKLSELMDMSK